MKIQKTGDGSSSKSWWGDSFGGLIVPLIVFGALWCLLIAQLSQFWAAVPEYSFGWFVPVCSAYLFLRRWKSRPPADIPMSRGTGWIFWLTGLALLPTWLIGQANPDWRLIAWALAIETVALSLFAIYFAGGASWLRHFGFSVCLILAAVPWPVELEEPVIRALTRASTIVTVAALNLFQMNAVRHGNVVELKTGFIGIDEACSGIRSLQAAFMLSLFLGELHRTSIRRRCGIVLGAGAIAFACNAVRTFLLTAIASEQGAETMANWHDPIGYAMLIICFLSIWGMARVISGPVPMLTPAAQKAPISYPKCLILCLGGWILFTVLFTEIWYRTHERTGTVQWSVVWPAYKRDFADIPISKFEADALLFDQGRGAEWTNGDGSHWAAYFFRWIPGPSRSRILARAHRPENCFPGAGYKLCGDHDVITIEAKGFAIPFHALEYEGNGEKDYVFFCLWEEGLNSLERPLLDNKLSRLLRLRSVLLGQRNLGQQTLEVVISGYDSTEQAEIAFRREMASLIQARTNPLVFATSD